MATAHHRLIRRGSEQIPKLAPDQHLLQMLRYCLHLPYLAASMATSVNGIPVGSEAEVRRTMTCLHAFPPLIGLHVGKQALTSVFYKHKRDVAIRLESCLCLSLHVRLDHYEHRDALSGARLCKRDNRSCLLPSSRRHPCLCQSAERPNLGLGHRSPAWPNGLCCLSERRAAAVTLRRTSLCLRLRRS